MPESNGQPDILFTYLSMEALDHAYRNDGVFYKSAFIDDIMTRKDDFFKPYQQNKRSIDEDIQKLVMQGKLMEDFGDGEVLQLSPTYMPKSLADVRAGPGSVEISLDREYDQFQTPYGKGN